MLLYNSCIITYIIFFSQDPFWKNISQSVLWILADIFSCPVVVFGECPSLTSSDGIKYLYLTVETTNTCLTVQVCDLAQPLAYSYPELCVGLHCFQMTQKTQKNKEANFWK
jgi:hypothetical protein